MPASLVLTNGKIITVDERFSIQSAVAVKDGKIIAVGGEELRDTFNAATVIDLKGRVLMPGFMDTHIHVQSKSPRAIDLESAKSIADVQRMLREKAAQLGAAQWITGYGWDEALLAEKRNITRADLDAGAPRNPVVLTRAGSHSVVGNSLALKIAKIGRDTPDPKDGLIEHDASGEPNGIIRERNDLLYSHVPEDKWEGLRAGYVATLQRLFSLGITSIIEATGSIDDEPVGKGGAAGGRGRRGRDHQARTRNHRGARLGGRWRLDGIVLNEEPQQEAEDANDAACCQTPPRPP